MWSVASTFSFIKINFNKNYELQKREIIRNQKDNLSFISKIKFRWMLLVFSSLVPRNLIKMKLNTVYLSMNICYWHHFVSRLFTSSYHNFYHLIEISFSFFFLFFFWWRVISTFHFLILYFCPSWYSNKLIFN